MAMAEAHQGGKQREGWGLDADIVEQALSHVSTQHRLAVCALACRTWRDAAVRITSCTIAGEDGNETVVRVVNSSRDTLTDLRILASYSVNDSLILRLDPLPPLLSTLSLSGCDGVGHAGIRLVASSCPCLTALDLSDLTQIVDDTASLLTSLTALTLLSLRGCRGISSAAPPLLGASLTSLGSLNISHCWRVNTISNWGKNLSNLVDLNVSSCADLVDITPLPKSCPNLTSLNASGCGITIASLQSLCSHAPLHPPSLDHSGPSAPPPSLSHVDVSDCMGLTNLSPLVASTPRGLTSLSLSGNTADDLPQALNAVAVNNGSALSCLRLSKCVTLLDEDVTESVALCTALQVLSLRSCDALTDDAAIAVSRKCLDLTELSVLGCFRFTDQGLIPLAMSGTRLRVLHLGGCGSATDSFLQTVGTHCLSLRELRVDDCYRLTDQGAKSLASLTQLVMLSLSECSGIGDVGVRCVISGSRDIRELELGGLWKITDDLLRSVSSFCPRLAMVDLRRCERISDAGILHLASCCQKLRIVSMAGCKGVTLAGADKVRAALPACNVLW